MTDHFARPQRAASSPCLAELHQLCDEDYIKGQQQRATPHIAPSYAALSLADHGPAPEPTDLDVAIRVAQQLLDSDSVLSLREAIRLLLRALGAEPVKEQGYAPVPPPSGDQPGHVAPSSLPEPVTDLFAAIADALNVPLPSTNLDDERVYHRLIERRALHVRILLESLSGHPDVSIHRDAADVRSQIEQTPVTYTTFDDEKAAAEQRGEGQ